MFYLSGKEPQNRSGYDLQLDYVSLGQRRDFVAVLAVGLAPKEQQRARPQQHRL